MTGNQDEDQQTSGGSGLERRTGRPGNGSWTAESCAEEAFPLRSRGSDGAQEQPETAWKRGGFRARAERKTAAQQGGFEVNEPHPAWQLAERVVAMGDLGRLTAWGSGVLRIAGH